MRAIEGYGHGECNANHIDDLAVPVSWRGRDLAPLVSREVYMRFFLRNMFLFGVRFDSWTTPPCRGGRQSIWT